MEDELDDILRGLQVGKDGQCAVLNCEALAVKRQFCQSCFEGAERIGEARNAALLRKNRLESVNELIAEKIGKGYVDVSWDGLDVEKEVLDQISSAVLANRSVIMTGKPGVGKTHILTCILRKLYLSGEDVEVWTCPELLDLLRSLAMGDQPLKRERQMLRFREAGWLFIDDIGVEKTSEFGIEQLLRIIDWRSRDESPVVVTSNLTLDEMAKRYDGRMASRLRGLAGKGGAGVTISGKDHR